MVPYEHQWPALCSFPQYSRSLKAAMSSTPWSPKACITSSWNSRPSSAGWMSVMAPCPFSIAGRKAIEKFERQELKSSWWHLAVWQWPRFPCYNLPWQPRALYTPLSPKNFLTLHQHLSLCRLTQSRKREFIHYFPFLCFKRYYFLLCETKLSWFVHCACIIYTWTHSWNYYSGCGHKNPRYSLLPRY